EGEGGGGAADCDGHAGGVPALALVRKGLRAPPGRPRRRAGGGGERGRGPGGMLAAMLAFVVVSLLAVSLPLAGGAPRPVPIVGGESVALYEWTSVVAVLSQESTST